MKIIFRSLLSLVFFATLTLSAQAKPETYIIDPAHSSVGFKIGHFFSRVPGHFDKFSGTIVVDREAMEKSEIKAEIDAASINTANEKRDNHLRAPDFFDTAQFPKITFSSKTWKQIGENDYEVTGDFTLHGVTKSIVLHVKSLGFGEGRPGSNTYLSGWEGRTKLKRSDYDIKSGAPAVGDEVEIEINIEASRQ